jgi:iron complex outermembrane receptor protein
MNKLSWVVFSTLALAAAARAQDRELEEIVVLADRVQGATKTDTLLIEIPQSISVVTSEQIAERGAQSYQEVFRYSGVDTERQGLEVRGDFFSLRGFALKQYVDGLNTTPDFIYGSRQEVFTLERVEVLRGPSAVMYGAGSSGGLVNAVSKRPKFEPGGEIGLQAGNFDLMAVQADITGPLGEQFAGRIVGMIKDGELISEGQANDKDVLLPSITWRPGDRTEVTLIGLYQKEDLGTHTYLPTEKTLNAGGDDPPVKHDLFIGEPGFNHMDAEQYGVTLLFTHRFNDMVAFSTSNRYLDSDVDYAEVWGCCTYADPERTLLNREFYVLVGDYKVTNSDTNVQLDFDTGPLKHKVLVGLDYTKFEHSREEGFSCGTFTGPPCWAGGAPPPIDVYDPVYGAPFTYGFTGGYRTESNQLGLYLQDQMKVGEKVSIVLGARRDESDNQRFSHPKYDSPGSPKEKTDAETYKAGIIGEVFEGFSPYANYSESFTPLFGTDFYGNHYDPQESRQYEGGFKWQPNKSSLVSGAYFDIEETGFLSQDPDNIQNFLQGGAIGVKGWELEAIVNLDNGFGITANYTDMDAEVLKGTTNAPAGSRVPNLPETIASAWLNKTFVVNDDLAWRIGAGVRYNGDEDDGFGLITPSVTLYDAMGEVSYKDWNVQLNVNNIADKEYFSSCGSAICAPALPRVIFGTVTKKF